LKLERVGLFDQFSFGGFGCDAEDRVELVRIGAKRGAAILGQPLERCRIVVIGDTPKDTAAARALDAQCIGVGTGSYSPEQLLAEGATHAFADFTAPGAVSSLIGIRS
jgi:phosphoglycolate phosphatase-like HAD superfamily hydrolase